ncbi:MAG: Crp/Fnr family transcriptional regulator [Lewinellaceae bacterium]|nr:Crp/Fnr family transcriptional regulator [Lewinellaceae bacterium]
MTDAQKQAELRKFFFKPLPFWESIPASLWAEMQAVSQPLSCPKKTLIYSEGSYPRSLYIIRKGRVKVYIINNEGAGQIIYFLGKDEVFGHRSIVCDEPSPVFIEAIDDCVLEAIPRYHFEDFLQKSPELNAAFLYYLGHEFRVFVNKISVFAQKPVSERVALALLVLNEKFNDHPQSVMLLNFTREDLASYVGTATENLIRQLKTLKEARAVIIRGRKIIIEETDLLWERARVLLYQGGA